MFTQITSIRQTILISVASSMAVYYSRGLLQQFGNKLVRLVFNKIEVPVENNKLLVTKINGFLKTHSVNYGGSDTIIENGKDRYYTGHLLTFKPFCIVSINPTKITIWSYRQTTSQFLNYMEQINQTDNTINIYTLLSPSDNWQKVKTLERTQIPLLYTQQMMSQLDSNINNFLNSKQKYRLLGQTHKTTMLFYGSPGTGKTNCVKWLAMKYARDIYIIDPSICQSDFPISNISHCQGGILLFEDIDRYFADLYAKQQKPNISKFLNFLDGLCTPDNIIIILTANYEGDIPESIKRDGRIDLTVHMSMVNDEILERICQTYQVDKSLITINNRVTTSEVVKKIEENIEQLRSNQTIIINGTNQPSEKYSSIDFDSVSVLND